MAIDLDTLFANLGKAFYVQELVNTARGTTIPPDVKDFLDQYGSASLELKKAVAGVEPGNRAMQSGMATLMRAMQVAAQQVIIETVEADTALDRKDITTALVELIRQMVAGAESVDASTGAASASAVTGNGNGVMVVSAKRADGLNAENILAETIRLECTADGTPATATFTAHGDSRIQDSLSSDWPGGSGITRSIQAIDAADSLLTNGDFEDEDDRSNAPDGWIVETGTIGTTIKITDVEVQEIAITGPPTAGTYVINVTNAASVVQTTTPLAYNATGSEVQAAINALIGFEDATVSTAGTSPLFTHTITFNGIAGNLATVSVTNGTTGGTFTPAQVTAGSAHSFVGKALEFDSNGSENTTILCPITGLEPLKQYAFNCWMKADVVPAAGVISIDLIDGSSQIDDEQAGGSNSLAISCPALTTSFVAKNFTIRTPRVLPDIVLLRITISTDISSGTSVFIDHAAIGEMTELYPDGPWVAIFSGSTPFVKGSGQVVGDYFTLTATNDRAGEFQEWFERNFAMRAKGLLLPSDSGGSETLADSLIA